MTWPDETPGQVLRWWQLVATITLERLTPLLSEMGVPRAICASPDPLRECARPLLRSVPPTGDPAAANAAVEGMLRAVADAYGLDTTRELQRFALDRFIDDRRTAPLDAWTVAVRIIGRGALAGPGSAAAAACAQRHRGRAAVLEARSHLEAARERPASCWELELDERTRLLAGDDMTATGAGDAAIDTAALLIAREQTARAARCIAKELRLPDVESLIESIQAVPEFVESAPPGTTIAAMMGLIGAPA
jgi:hypothetical protein